MRKDIIWRVALLYIGMIIFALFILGRVLYLQIGEGAELKEKAREFSQKDLIIEPNRGDIYSSDGKVLASSVPFYEVRFDTKVDGITEEFFTANIDSLAWNLTQLFKDKTEKEYRENLMRAWKNGDRYFLIRRKVTYYQMKQLRTFPIFRLGKYKGGLIAIQENKRAKPFGILASRTIGFTTEDNTKVGIEGAFDTYLRGVQGIKLMQRLAGDVWMPVNNGNEVEPQDGLDVITTIDVRFQDVAESALLEQLQLHNAHHGCVVLMEVETGYIKAIANLERTDSNTYRETYNYAIGESTEPGSTFKLVSLLVALEDGFIDVDDTIKTGNGVATYYNMKMKDSHEGGYGNISVSDVFAFSSNVGISKIITMYYSRQPQRYVDRIYKLRLNEKLGLDIKGEGQPMIKDPSDSLWSGVSLPWMSIGYEVKLTPLQILNLYNAVANDGRMMKPRLVKELRHRGEVIKSYEPEVLNPSICSKETLGKLRMMLEGVVDHGTAKNLKNPLYQIAGKTGTAQVANLKYGYTVEGGKSYQASFVGYFPADKPKYSCIVVVNAPSNEVYYGNLVAGPIFKEIADKVYATSLEIHEPLNLLEKMAQNIPVSMNGKRSDLELLCNELSIPVKKAAVPADWVITHKQTNEIAIENRVFNSHQVPNVVGMGLRDALYLLENNGLSVKVVGKGTVKSQSLPAGTDIDNNSTIIIELS